MTAPGRSWRVVRVAGWPTVYIATLGIYIALAWPGLSAPLLWDDLHLIRAYTPTELAGVWFGPWDPDGVETPGFRPLSTLFNHARGSLLGESTVAQRLFVLTLFALYVTLLGRLATAVFGSSRLVGFLASLLAFGNVANAANYLWVADGVHAIAGCLIVGALLGLVQGVRSGRASSLVCSLAAAAAALLTRPEANAVYPLAALLVVVVGRWAPTLGLRLYALGAFGLLAAYWAWQVAVVPGLEPIGVYPREYGWALYEAALGLSNSDHAVLWPAQARLAGIAMAGLAGTMALAVAVRSRPALVWTIAALVSAVPCLTGARSNLLLLPIGFWSLALASALVDGARLNRAVTASAILAFAAIAIPGLIVGRTLALEHRRENIEWACAEAVALAGDLGTATIPPRRRESVLGSLDGLGVRPGQDVPERLLELADKQHAFLPTLSLLVDPGGKVTPCGATLMETVR